MNILQYRIADEFTRCLLYFINLLHRLKFNCVLRFQLSTLWRLNEG